MKTIELETVAWKKVIGASDLVYCNTKYHAPYLAVLKPGQDKPEWQQKVYVGYGKHRQTYYVVEKLKPGDIIKAAGGSGKNEYPYHGRVVSVDDRELVVEEISLKELSNLMVAKDG